MSQKRQHSLKNSVIHETMTKGSKTFTKTNLSKTTSKKSKHKILQKNYPASFGKSISQSPPPQKKLLSRSHFSAPHFPHKTGRKNVSFRKPPKNVSSKSDKLFVREFVTKNVDEKSIRMDVARKIRDHDGIGIKRREKRGQRFPAADIGQGEKRGADAAILDVRSADVHASVAQQLASLPGHVKPCISPRISSSLFSFNPRSLYSAADFWTPKKTDRSPLRKCRLSNFEAQVLCRRICRYECSTFCWKKVCNFVLKFDGIFDC